MPLKIACPCLTQREFECIEAPNVASPVSVLVQVLMHSHSADYEVDSLPDDVQRHVTAEVRKFLSAKDAEGKQGRRGRTQGVSWGFKAPVSMLLVPFFAQMTSGVKFLHVVSSQAVYASRLKRS